MSAAAASGQGQGPEASPARFATLQHADNPATALAVHARDEVPKQSLVWQLTDDWYCYWSDDYSVPKDPEINFTFKPPLQLTRAGVVVPGGLLSTLSTPEDKFSYLEAQSMARAAAFPQGQALRLDGLGSESDQPVEPLVCSLPAAWVQRDFKASEAEAKAFFPDLLAHMGAHAELAAVLKVHTGDLSQVPEELLGEEDGDDGGVTPDRRLLYALCTPAQGQALAAARRAFATTLGCCAWAVVGEDKLNPVPVLVLRRCNDRFLAGVISAVIYT